MRASQHVEWKQTWREAFLNAVIHKDSSCAVPIQIRVYDHQVRMWMAICPRAGQPTRCWAPTPPDHAIC